MLASRSPQRRAILEQLRVPFRVTVPDVEERTEGEPAELAVANARRKAKAVEGELVLGVDTTVVVEERVLGKPRDRGHAEAMLRTLSGRTHAVVSGICLLAGGEESCAHATTAVRFRRLSDRNVSWYLATDEWRGRAGGYAIQGRGAVLVESIDGDFWNVVGLPVAELVRLAPALLWEDGEPPQRSIVDNPSSG